MVTVTAELVETTAPKPVQVAVTDVPDGVGFTLVGVAPDGRTWPVPGGVGVVSGGTVSLVDNRAPFNVPVRYRVTLADGTQAMSPEVVPGAVLRRNLVSDPRATDAARWTASWGTGGAGTETPVTPETPKRTNLAPQPFSTATSGPMAQASAASWGGANPTVSSVEDPTAPSGNGFARRFTAVVPKAAGSADIIYATWNNRVPITVGIPVTLSLWVRVSAQIAVQPQAQFLTAAGGGAGSVNASPAQVTLQPGIWTRLSVTATATNPDATNVRFDIDAAATTAWDAGFTIDHDALLIETGSILGDYFDGGTQGAPGVTNAWAGAVNGSVSTQAFNDGPVLPDGTQVGTFMRYTVATPGTSASQYGWSPPGSFAGAPQLVPGEANAGAIYVRASASGLQVRGYVGAYLGTGSNAVSAFSPYVTSVAGEWVRLAISCTPLDWVALRTIGAQILTTPAIPPGATIDVTCAMVEPGATSLGPHFDGASSPSAAGIPAWEGTPNASASVLREALPLQVAYPSHVIQSLDGDTLVIIESLRDNGLPQQQTVRSVAFDVPGRRRPPRRHAPSGDGGGTLEIRTSKEGSRALRALVGQTVVVRTDGRVRDWPAVELIAIDSASSVLWGAADPAAPHGMSEGRVWQLGYTLADDPEPGTAIALWSWEDFDAYWAARSWNDFDTFWADQDWALFDQMAWE